MAQKDTVQSWDKQIAILTAIVAVLAAITSLQVSSTTSLILLEKNNANNLQARANKQWNSYLALDITKNIRGTSSGDAQQESIKKVAENLELQASEATEKAEIQLKRSGDFTTAGTLFEISIALLAMTTLIRKKMIWFFSLGLTFVGLCFFFLGVV